MKQYRIHMQKVTYREMRTEAGPIAAALAWVISRLPLKFPSSSNFPATDSLEPFRVAKDRMPPEVLAELQPHGPKLHELGFRGTVYYAIIATQQATRVYYACYLHTSGKVVARAQYRVFEASTPHKKYNTVEFMSRSMEGNYLVTSNAGPDLTPPSMMMEEYHKGLDIDSLWTRHQQRLVEQTVEIQKINDAKQMLVLMERYQRHISEHFVQRGLFVLVDEPHSSPREEVPLASTGGVSPDGQETEPHDHRSAMMLSELRKMESKRSMTGWGKLALLVVSIIGFLLAANFQWSWQTGLLLILVLFIHELGHFAFMKLFDYQNVNMFFIPMFGAAVSGRSYNVAGWQRVMVSLMGPLPGIFLGTVLGIWGWYFNHPWLMPFALLMLFLNAFNLLPVLPLDGGHVMHVLVFARHATLDLVFRVGAALVLLALSIFGDWFFRILGIGMLVNVPTSYKLAKITDALRKEGAIDASYDNHSIPDSAIRRIAPRIRSAFPQGLSHKQEAKLVSEIYERVTTEPPGVLSTLCLGSIYMGGFFVATVAGILLSLAQSTDLSKFVGDAFLRPEKTIAVEQIVDPSRPNGGEPIASERSTFTLFAPTKNEVDAEQGYQECLSFAEASSARVVRWGNDILVGIPASHESDRDAWLSRMELWAEQPFVDSAESHVSLRLQCLAATSQDADRIGNELQGYFYANQLQPMIPPWSETNTLSLDQQLARSTLAKLRTGPPEDEDGSTDAANPSHYEQLETARRRGDRAEISRLQAEFNAAEQRRCEQFFDDVAALPENEVIPQVVAIFRQVHRLERSMWQNEAEDSDDSAKIDPAKKGQLDSLNAEMAQLMGLATNGSDPKQIRDRLSAISGFSHTNGLMIVVDSIVFTDVLDGAPAFLRWLDKNGCTDMHYSFDFWGF